MAVETKKKVKKEKIPRVSMPEQEPAVRAKNFLEVPTGYTPEMAMQEAARCIQCKKHRRFVEFTRGAYRLDRGEPSAPERDKKTG